MTNINYWRLMAGLLLVCFASGSAHAEVPTDGSMVVTPAPPAGIVELGGDAINGEQLASLRGGAEQVNSENALEGLVRDNQAYNLKTGSNLVSDGSFAGSSGLATVIQNSGNNVLIQNSTIVNVQIK
ncbi:hypothetical protein AT959_00380 [Dechloromonas denitrificans]|uniref:Carbon storage regulator n=1 Tax=Dechloromonas denitrificans TaxID=281362 RepID=A0A133XP31_9RHOO|nr:hypothetical protein [Dechloromonas denitrificans]KXB32693.1 hypothetical protein AT959_00380 [Dechloromonas denitrificans]